MTLTGDDQVVVIGQGYVGLPIALRAVEVGYHVVGFDVDKDFGPILAAGSGLRAGADFHLGYSPERIDPSNPTWGLQNTPKIVSGADEASAAAVAAYRLGPARPLRREGPGHPEPAGRTRGGPAVTTRPGTARSPPRPLRRTRRTPADR
jgi:hypothetical protein